MIAAPKSGSGKTIITCGLLKLLKDRGCDVRSYKCGPDYIDPMFHRSVIAVPGGNLDSFFSSDEEITAILSENDCEAAVIEGVMGIYDGITGTAGRGSCYDVASATKTPVVLVMDVKGMGQTMLSLMKGILSDDSLCLIRGVVLNRISSHYYEEISPLIGELLSELSEKRGVSVCLLGGIPDSKGIKLESRHLGLMMPEEIADLKDQVGAAAELINHHLDMDLLERIMEGALELPDAGKEEKDSEPAVTLAVARDEAFCFYYEENLRMLKRCGMKLVEFSPLHDSFLPEEADGLLLGGGYPELHVETLSSNKSMLESIRQAINDGMPSLAECGGFIYLMEDMADGGSHKGQDLLHFRAGKVRLYHCQRKRIDTYLRTEHQRT